MRVGIFQTIYSIFVNFKLIAHQCDRRATQRQRAATQTSHLTQQKRNFNVCRRRTTKNNNNNRQRVTQRARHAQPPRRRRDATAATSAWALRRADAAHAAPATHTHDATKNEPNNPINTSFFSRKKNIYLYTTSDANPNRAATLVWVAAYSACAPSPVSQSRASPPSRSSSDSSLNIV